MAVRDLEAFLRQAAANFDSNLDVTAGTPFDTKVIQPLVRRLGMDPFSVDLSTFLSERLKQAYPKLATDEGDNLADLLIKPITLLWDPLVRENVRVRRGLSFSDPTTLTLEEADSLGGNFFVPRKRGGYARGQARILFSKAQDVSINQNNFVTSRGGLVFFPSSLQSIRKAELAINVTADGLYYFDVSVVAESPGSTYNIDPAELTSIANLNAAVRVTNVRRFSSGEDEENAVEYVNRLQQSLGEKSMVTLRGIAAKLLESFPEVNRLNVVGYNDPEMQRDVLTGGGLGPVVASGNAGVAIDDANGAARTRRFYTAEADFDLLVGADSGYVITILGGTTGTSVAEDLPIASVYDVNTIDLVDQSLVLGRSGLPWILRKNELTLSGIPGGILFPNTATGDLRIDSGSVHVGGAYDVYTRSTDSEEATLSLSAVFDDSPILNGVAATYTVAPSVGFLLSDYGISATQEIIDLLDTASYEGYSFQVQDGPNAGTYRIVERQTTGTGAMLLLVDPLPANSDPVARRWRLFDQVNVDLAEPKETRVSGDDLVVVQGSNVVTTSGGLDFDALGVAKGDTLRITTGSTVGDYTLIADPIVPGYANLQVDRAMPFSDSDVDYVIFRGAGEGLSLPFIRIKSIELLDSSSQPQGSYIPYAKPVDVQSRSFQNPSRGVKHEYRNASLGLVSTSANASTKLFTITAGANSLTFYIGRTVPLTTTVSVPIGTYTVDALIAQLNALLLAATGYAGMASRLNDYYFGIRPMGNGYVALVGGTARPALFGGNRLRTTADIETTDVPGTWANLDPAIDLETGLDTVQVVDGRNVGFYGGPFVVGAIQSGAGSWAIMPGETFAGIQAGSGLKYFSPDVNRHVLVGTRSIGSVRVYFLEPTSFEVTADTVFSLESSSGTLRFIPDPTMEHQKIPALPDGSEPTDGGSANGGTTFTSVSQSFRLSGVKPGDDLVVKTHPLMGSISLTDPVVGLAGTTLTYALDESPDRTIVFVRDDASLAATDVTLQGAVAQINASAGEDIAELSGSQLMFRTARDLVLRATSTAPPILLGNVANYTPTRTFVSADINNASPHAGRYDVSVVGETSVTTATTFPVSANWATPVTDQTFAILRKGVQRVTTTQMSGQQAEASLYYADFELVSQGAGDAWNIDAGEQLTVTGYKSDGYYLTTDDSNLTFSPAERPKLVISRTILEDGVDDDPQNATQVTGQNIEILYDRSTTVQNVQDFAMSEVERVVCASPLSRHLIPHYVRYDFEYFGGSDESVVLADHEKYIKGLFPIDSLDASDLQKSASDRGATKVTNPLTLIAVVHGVDRGIWVQRSQDSLSTGRLSAFIPDIINVSRNVTGG